MACVRRRTDETMRLMAVRRPFANDHLKVKTASVAAKLGLSHNAHAAGTSYKSTLYNDETRYERFPSLERSINNSNPA